MSGITVLRPDNFYCEKYRVPSESDPDKEYVVSLSNNGEWACSCPRWIYKRRDLPGGRCKHINHLLNWKTSQSVTKPKPSQPQKPQKPKTLVVTAPRVAKPTLKPVPMADIEDVAGGFAAIHGGK